LPEWLGAALQQIRRPEHFTLGPRQLARLAGRCLEHVTRSLKACLGTTATDVVNEARLDHAALQLRMTPLKIIDVALECGYQNIGHFYGLFRQRFGVSPRQYRLRHQATLR
jgi:AraC family cel operon transcriptional repressor